MEEANLVYDAQQKKFFIYVDMHFYREAETFDEAIEWFKKAYKLVVDQN